MDYIKKLHLTILSLIYLKLNLTISSQGYNLKSHFYFFL